jgi:hypothetical protein
MADLTEEEQRALAWQQRRRRRRAAEKARAKALAGDPAAYKRLLRETQAISQDPYRIKIP